MQFYFHPSLHAEHGWGLDLNLTFPPNPVPRGNTVTTTSVQQAGSRRPNWTLTMWGLISLSQLKPLELTPWQLQIGYKGHRENWVEWSEAPSRQWFLQKDPEAWVETPLSTAVDFLWRENGWLQIQLTKYLSKNQLSLQLYWEGLP